MSNLRLPRVLSLLAILAVLWGYLPQPAWAAAPRRAVRPAPLQQGPGGRRQVFRTDFNSAGNFEGWHIMRQPANTSVLVTNGYLQLSTTGDTAEYPVVERTGIPWPAGDMEIEWRFSSPDAGSRSGFGVNTWVTNGFTKIGSYGIYGSPGGYIWSEYDSAGPIRQGLDSGWHTALIIRHGGVYDFYLDGAYKASWNYAGRADLDRDRRSVHPDVGGAVADHAAGLLRRVRLSADADAHRDGNGNSHGDAYGHRNPHADRDRDTDPDGNADCHAHADADEHTDVNVVSHGDANADVFADTDGYGDAHGHAHQHAEPHRNVDVDTQSDADGDRQSHAYTDANGYCDRDADVHPIAHRHADPHRHGHRQPHAGGRPDRGLGVPGHQRRRVAAGYRDSGPVRGLGACRAWAARPIRRAAWARPAGTRS